jgi:hypothetical protein
MAAVAAVGSPFDVGFPSYASKRASMMSTATASTTKSTLRASNAALIDMLQNIQGELQAHRSLMLDIHQGVQGLDRRVSGLEQYQAKPSVEDESHDRRWSHRSSAQIEWLEACQNFARNSNPPISASEFLKSGEIVSGKSSPYPRTPVPPKSAATLVSHGLDTPPVTPPEDVGDDADDGEVQVDSVTISPDGTIEEVRVSPASPTSVYASSPDTTRTVEIEIREDTPPPPVPILQAAPSPKRTPSYEEKSIGDSQRKAAEQFAGPPVSGPPEKSASSPEMVQQNSSRRMFQGKRSLQSYQARLFNKKNDKGMLLPFFKDHLTVT